MHLAISALVTSIACVQTVLGHGHMYHPSPWHANYFTDTGGLVSATTHNAVIACSSFFFII